MIQILQCSSASNSFRTQYFVKFSAAEEIQKVSSIDNSDLKSSFTFSLLTDKKNNKQLNKQSNFFDFFSFTIFHHRHDSDRFFNSINKSQIRQFVMTTEFFFRTSEQLLFFRNQVNILQIMIAAAVKAAFRKVQQQQAQLLIQTSFSDSNIS